jgi:hypothetical protein
MHFIVAHPGSFAECETLELATIRAKIFVEKNKQAITIYELRAVKSITPLPSLYDSLPRIG